MRLKTLAITAGALGILAAALAPLAFHPDTTQAASSSKQNLAGTWVLDKSKSDKPPGGPHGGKGHGEKGDHPDGPPMGPPPGGGGPDGMHQGGKGGKGGGGGMRRGLPRLMHITSGAQGFSVADSSGTIVEDITFETVSKENADKMPPQVQGTWQGDKLVVSRSGQRGSMTQTFELDKDGNELTVRTKMERKDGEDMEMKRVYTRQRSS
jgi:hypothetical protein